MAKLNTKYFVLKPKGDNPYARAARKAIKVFAKEIADTDRELAIDLNSWIEELTPEAVGESNG